jgi:hypothetical protein
MRVAGTYTPSRVRVENCPCTEIVFLGIVMDTVRMELRLQQEKVGDLKLLLAKWARRKTC